MAFRKSHVELAFLDSRARLSKNAVYLSYALYLLILLSNCLFGYVQSKRQAEICSENGDVCREGYGTAWNRWMSDPGSNKLTFTSVVNFSMFRMTPLCAGILSGLVAAGFLSHWLIHRRVTQKAWALVSAWMVYLLLMAAMVSFALCDRLDPNLAFSVWASGSFISLIFPSILLIFFTAVTFPLFLIWWLAAFGLYYGLGIPVLWGDIATAQEYDDIEQYGIVYSCSYYLQNGNKLIIYAIIVVIGSYLKDITSRKRFLQQALMIKRQKDIVRTKTVNEKLQRQLLENILPFLGQNFQARRPHKPQTY